MIGLPLGRRHEPSDTSRKITPPNSAFDGLEQAIIAGDVAGAGGREPAPQRAAGTRAAGRRCVRRRAVPAGAFSRCGERTRFAKKQGESPIPARTSETRACAACRARPCTSAGAGSVAAAPRMHAHVPTHAHAPRPRRARAADRAARAEDMCCSPPVPARACLAFFLTGGVLSTTAWSRQ